MFIKYIFSFNSSPINAPKKNNTNNKETVHTTTKEFKSKPIKNNSTMPPAERLISIYTTFPVWIHDCCGTYHIIQKLKNVQFIANRVTEFKRNQKTRQKKNTK